MSRCQVPRSRVGKRPRGFVGVVGPDAASYLQRMLSNDVEALGPDESCDALLLTAKGRVVAPMTVYRRGRRRLPAADRARARRASRATLARSRFAAKVEVELEEHASALVVGRETPAGAVANREFGVAAYELSTRSYRPGARSTSTSSSFSGSGRPRRATDASSTIAFFPPKPGSTRERSTSRRGATRARSRSRASTTAGA